MEAEDSGARPPLLPTPTNEAAHIRTKTWVRDNSSVSEKWGNPSFHHHWSHPKLELQTFTGENPRDWLRKCNNFFSLHQFDDNEKLEVVDLYLDSKADVWYQSFRLIKGTVSWQEFSEALLRRFGDRTGRDEIEEFNKLQQTGSVQDYQDKFEELKTLLLYKDPRLSEQYFVSSFISGLREELKPVVRMMKPSSLIEAFEIAHCQEQSMDLQHKRQKMVSRDGVSQFKPLSNTPRTELSVKGSNVPDRKQGSTVGENFKKIYLATTVPKE